MMVVCSHCLMGIESHEGNQFARKATEEDLSYIVDMTDAEVCGVNPWDTYSVCEWCEEEKILDDLWVID